MSTFLLTLALVVVLLGTLYVLMPILTRPDVFFSVTVVPEFRRGEEGRQIIRGYRLWVVVASLVGLTGVALAGRSPEPSPWAMTVVLPQLVAATAGFLLARRRVQPHAVAPAPTREATLIAAGRGLPGGWPVQVVPFVGLAGVASVLVLRWSDLPARVAVHIGPSGYPDQWVDKTPASVFAPVVLAAAMCALFVAMSVGLMHGPRVRASGAAARREDLFRRLTVLALFTGEMLIALTTAHLALQGLLAADTLRLVFGAAAAAAAVAMLVLVVLTIRLGQGGTRSAPADEVGAPIGDRTPDSAWKLGLFYVNHDDPALFVEKRFGVGYTINFGHPRAWVLLGLLLGVPLTITFFSR